MIVFAVFTVIELYISIKFAKSNQTPLLKQTVLSYALFAILLIVLALFKIKIPQYILIMVVTTFFVHSFFGNYLDLYNRSQHFDRYLHLFGSFANALFVYFIIIKSINPTVSSKLYSALFVVTLGISIGAFFEILEYSQDSKKNSNHQKGLVDTDFDIIFNVIGSAIAGVFAYFFVI